MSILNPHLLPACLDGLLLEATLAKEVFGDCGHGLGGFLKGGLCLELVAEG